MVFIPRNKLENREVGQWVELTRDMEVIAGKFTAGTRMKIIGEGERGLDFEDEFGNKLLETRMDKDFYKPIIG